MSPQTRKRFRLTAISIAVVVLVCFAGSILAWLFPKQNFRRMTGRSLPREAKVVKFESQLCDNLFRSCYYWKLEHPLGGHLSIIGDDKFRPGFDAEEGYRDDVLNVLDSSVSGGAIGQALKLDIPFGSHFLFVHTNGTNSYYYKGTL